MKIHESFDGKSMKLPELFVHGVFDWENHTDFPADSSGSKRRLSHLQRGPGSQGWGFQNGAFLMELPRNAWLTAENLNCKWMI